MLHAAPTPYAPTLCPLCASANQCGAEAARLKGEALIHCWCMDVKIDASLQARLPPESVGRSCICAACVAAADAAQAAP